MTTEHREPAEVAGTDPAGHGVAVGGPDATGGDDPATVHGRALALVDYLLALRALLDKPARTVPAADAHWQGDLPAHPDCQLGPREPGGSWLRVSRPAPPPPPPVPEPLRAYVRWDGSPESPPVLAREGADEQVVAELTRWYDESWRPWSVAANAAYATRRLHDRLYDLRYRLDMDAARAELVWGHLVLDAQVGDEHVHYPLLATPVAIDYDPETATVSVSPQGPPRLQVDPLHGLDDRRLTDLLGLGGPGGQVGLDPWEEPERRRFAERALRRLGMEPLIDDRRPGEPYLLDTGVLFVRPRQRMVRRFLERMRDDLAGAGPSAVGALGSVLAHEPSQLQLPGDDAEGWQRTADHLLMPLATNDEQESIARRLGGHRSVAVQGPPGTGKTHTIRNLICHLVAHGKRVLVLAQKEDPLRVLRDGLPEQIQPLCLAVLGRSADQLVQLQTAARELSDRAATLDQPREAARVAQLGDQIAEASAQLEQVQEALAAAAERVTATLPWDGVQAPASAVGGWLRRHESERGVIPDPVDPATELPLTPGELTELLEVAARTSAGERAAALGSLPEPARLPSGEQVAARRDALRDARKVVDALRDRGLTIDGVRELGAGRADELAAQLRTAADDLARREGTWTDRLGQLVRDPHWQQVWDRHVAACQELLAELARRTSFVAGRRVQVAEPYGAQPRQLLAQLARLRERLAAGKRVRRWAGGELARLAAACQVDGESVRTTADADLVIATVERARLRDELANRWTEWADRLGLPAPDGDAELWAGRLLSEAVDALDWQRQRWPEVRETLARIYPACPRAVDARQAGELAGALEACSNVFLADEIETERGELARWLGELAGADQAGGPARDLLTAWRAEDLAAWDAAAGEAARLWTLRPQAARYAELRDRLAAVAPQWAARVDSGTHLPDSAEHAGQAWRWRQAQTWFDDVVGGVDTDVLGRQAERCRDRIRRLTHELVVASAWLEVSRTLDDRRKAALADWTAALRKIGKGTGKSASHWQAVAQQAMAEAVTAVPVWIMSIDRALEQFDGGGQPLFDVVVVDEASQADVFALPVLSLARRAVVVGDDQQIGPQLVGVPADRMQSLITSHLSGVPSAAHFDTESSLYDHAVRRSPQRILLTEHFRCAPPIIAFSSGAYYDGRIQPLRADRPVGLGGSVQAVAVPDGQREALPEFGQVNVAEAEALVARVVAIVADPAYRGRSIGVVSLLSGSGQAAYLQHRLREQVGAAELERRALRVGDPYTFQGDERDVVLISTVVATADGDVGAFTKRDFHRRVNVAASRARDQLWLFHSIGVRDLRDDDARAMLLAHALAPPAFDDENAPAEQRCESDLELAVLRRLATHGLYPVPQYRIGSYRIDFVLAAPDGRRLAIECDEDGPGGVDGFAHQLRRQALLERVGDCVFVRVRAGAFARDPDAAMAPVWERAEQLGLSGRS